MRTVHEKRRDHACPHCAAAFGTAGNLTTHVRAVHRHDDEESLLLLLRSRSRLAQVQGGAGEEQYGSNSLTINL
jgi:hypothetical protein